MKSVSEYLDAVKKRLDLPSDYAAAKALGVTPSAISKYRLGRASFDDLTCLRVAEILGVDEIEVIAAANAARANDPRIRRVWENVWGKATGATVTAVLAVSILGLAAAPSTARCAPVQAESATLYLMSNRRRFRKTTVWDEPLAA
jgi:transcriptional regulator with XRE-family HTH domain